MSVATIDKDELKEVVKTAIVETLREQQGLLQGLVDDAVEDAFLARAIDEGKTGERVSQEEIFAILEGVR